VIWRFIASASTNWTVRSELIAGICHQDCVQGHFLLPQHSSFSACLNPRLGDSKSRYWPRFTVPRSNFPSSSVVVFFTVTCFVAEIKRRSSTADLRNGKVVSSVTRPVTFASAMKHEVWVKGFDSLTIFFHALSPTVALRADRNNLTTRSNQEKGHQKTNEGAFFHANTIFHTCGTNRTANLARFHRRLQ